MNNSFIIEAEIEGVRSFYGPFSDLVSARKYVDEHQSANKKMVHILHTPLPVPLPNQTTIEEHIDAVHDHVG